jgi:hypothetical protein
MVEGWARGTVHPVVPWSPCGTWSPGGLRADAAQELGADEAVDYSKPGYLDKYIEQPFDAIVDLVGGEALAMPCDPRDARESPVHRATLRCHRRFGWR